MLIAGTLLGCSARLAAQGHISNDNPLKTRLDSAADRAALTYLQEEGTHSILIGIVRNGEGHAYHYGHMLTGEDRLPTSQQYYNIGSVAKTFVATLLAEAVVGHRVNMQTDIRHYLPGKYPNLEYLGHPVRVVDLANHTSGLPGTFHDFPAAITDSVRKLPFPQQVAFFNRYDAKAMLRDLHSVRPDTIPGTKFRYNSTAYSLLIYLLEQVYRRPFDQLVSRYLRGHLQMAQTSQLIPKAAFNRTAQGYGSNNQPMPYLNLTSYYMGPSINSNLDDMLTYVAAQLADTDPAIKLTHQQTFKDSSGFGIGLGWMIRTDNGQRYFYHDGNSKFGFNTLCTFYPGLQLGIVILVNDTRDLEKISQAEHYIKTHYR